MMFVCRSATSTRSRLLGPARRKFFDARKSLPPAFGADFEEFPFELGQERDDVWA